MKKLPVKKDTVIKSECWTHYRMKIIETSEDCDKWLCSHLRLSMVNSFGIKFGSDKETYDMSYYDSILDQTEIDIRDMPPVKTIARIKKEIDEGYYMVVFCNSSLVFAREFKEETHEIFIYGYNDKKKVFFTSELQGSGFKESEITYENFVKGYRYRYDYLSKNKEQILAMRIFYYDITKIKLKKFDNETYFLLGFIRKINYEIIGSRSKVYLCKPNMEYNTPDIYHEGIACLAGIKESLKKFIDGTIGDIDCYDRLTLSLLKLYEHRKILLRNFKWLYEHFNISNPELLSEINNYEKCCENVKKMYSISLKNDLAHEGKFFVLDDISVKAYLKIIGLITSQFAFELKTLKKCSEMFTAWFYDYRAIKKKIEDGK